MGEDNQMYKKQRNRANKPQNNQSFVQRIGQMIIHFMNFMKQRNVQKDSSMKGLITAPEVNL